MKNRESLKPDWNMCYLKLSFGLVPGAGARTFRAKTMRQLLFHGLGGPTKMRSAECGMQNKKARI
jgi:hypothetical protein